MYARNDLTTRTNHTRRSKSRSYSTWLNLMLLLSQATTGLAAIFYQTKDGRNHYLIDHASEIVTKSDYKIEPGVCNLVAGGSQDFNGNYEKILSLKSDVFIDGATFFAEIFRGMGETIDTDVDKCISKVISTQFEFLKEEIKENPHRHINLDDFLTVGIPILFTVGVVLLYLVNKLHTNRLINNNEVDLEANYAENQRLFPPKPKPPTMEERLEKIEITSVTNHPVAKNYICPFYLTVMNDPCVTDDGHSYEREALIELKAKNAKCPMNSSLPVQTITPNQTLKRLIIEFVESEEREYERRKARKEV